MATNPENENGNYDKDFKSKKTSDTVDTKMKYSPAQEENKNEINTIASYANKKEKGKKAKHKNVTDDEKTDQVNGTEPGYVSVQELKKAMEVLTITQRPAKTHEEAMQKPFQFWSTQPVPKLDESVNTSFNGSIEPDRPVESIRQTPYSLPDGFRWDTLDLENSEVLKELYTLLNENYVEDEDAMFRFDYPPLFLKWALQPPGWMMDWHVGVRVEKSGRLIGFISAIPAQISIYQVERRMVEINFLCVHKKLRSKRVAPVLIREITRRVHLQGIFQATYTAGVFLPKPIGTCRYYHRSLNPKKLIDVKFSHLSKNMTMQRTLKLYKLPMETKIPGFRRLVINDIPQTHNLLKQYMKKFDIYPTFSEEEFKHWFLSQPGIIDSFIVENNGRITDFVSYYTLPSTVMHHPIHRSIKAAYSFYAAYTTTNIVSLMQDALISAKNDGFDVFNALDLMENKTFLDPLKFGIGDGNLQYYVYNWKCPPINSDKIGLVLQ